uniref:Uncharacterized protein n=1 Tax=Meloidogyne enterolobii TaxID=390850 RepID=A0A6V7VV81_MELEN|nr:unnamed protein product [Meloidogyne enterolobii]
MEEEFSKIFPNFYKRIYYLRPDFDEIEKFRLIQSCCDFVDPEIILKTNHSTSKGLKLIGGPNFINYKYFDHLRSDILEIFKFNEDVILNISQLWNNTKFRNFFYIFIYDDFSHKLCVHIRVGDFIGLGESKSEQVVSSVNFITNKLASENVGNVLNFSLILFSSQDQNNFIENLKFKNELFNNIYRVSDLKLSRGEEMCLANQVCDSLLLSAPFSTFGFWMAYLLPEGRKIFSIRKQVKTFPFAFDTLNNLPPNWFQIEENLISKNI